MYEKYLYLLKPLKVKAHCPAMTQALIPADILALASRKQAEKAASLLKEWVKLHGSIQVGDLVYGPSQVVTYDLDAKLVTTCLLEAGLSREEVWSLFLMTKTNLKKGLRKLQRNDLI